MFTVLQAVWLIAGGTVQKKLVNLFGLDVADVGELVLQHGGVGERGLNAQFQTAVNMNID